MTTPMIRDGKMVGNLFEGVDYDLSLLTAEQGRKAIQLIDKSRAGQAMSGDDIKELMLIRKNARKPAPPTSPVEKLRSALRELREAVR